MQRIIYEAEELYSIIKKYILSILKDNVCSIILFGSTIYLGHGRDLDIIVVLRHSIDAEDKIKIEYTLSRDLYRKLGYTIYPDIHVMGKKDFIENLKPGLFLSGLALGYKILYDKCLIEEHILDFLEKLSKTKHILYNRYGEWDLGFHARLLVKRKRNR